jgi:hypothetical protein
MMKKIIAFLCAIGLFGSSGFVFGEQKTTLLFSLGSHIQGDMTECSIEILNLQNPMNEVSSLTIIFSKGFKLSNDIPIEAVTIDEGMNPQQIEVNGANNVHLILPPNHKTSIVIHFSIQAKIQNPIFQESASVSLVLEELGLILFSDSISMNPPENSVKVIYPKNIVQVGDYFKEEFSVSLFSELDQTIYFSLNESEFIVYTKPIQILYGKQVLEFYGQRKNGVIEPKQEQTFQVDSLPPLIKIIEPADKKLLNRKNQNLKVFINDFSTVHFQVQNQNIAVLPKIDGMLIEVPLILKPGENLVSYKAVDSVGFETSGTLTYYVDLTPPALVVYSPKKGDIVCGTRVEISGKVEVGAVVFVTNTKVKADEYGNFSLQIIPPSKGLNQLNILCIDQSGNEVRVNYSYYYFPGRLFEFLIGQNKGKIDNVEKEMTPAPLLDSQNGEVYVPLRFVADSLGFDLIWNSKEGRAVLKKSTNEIELRPNDSTVRIKEGEKWEKIELLYSPTLFKGSIMIPLEFLKKILGGEIVYDLSNNRVFVNFCDKGESQ